VHGDLLGDRLARVPCALQGGGAQLAGVLRVPGDGARGVLIVPGAERVPP